MPWKLLQAGSARLLWCAMMAMPLAGCTWNANGPNEPVEHAAEAVPFEDLFVLEDTLVLDPSVIVGFIWFLDADVAGNVLIHDFQANLVHMFASTGGHMATFDMDECLPRDFDHVVHAVRVVDEGRVVLTTMEGAMVVFDRSGGCLIAKQLTSPLLAFCSRGDSLFTFLGLQGRGTGSTVEVYSMDLEFQRKIPLPPPQFHRLTAGNLGFTGGRQMDCFPDGPYFKYPEFMDASPVYGHGAIRSRPEFFVERDRDLDGEPLTPERRASKEAFPELGGIYALEDDTRMMLFYNIREEHRPNGALKRWATGISIVSNSNSFSSVSTISPKRPLAARHGVLYFVGDNVPNEDGDVGNQAILRYRFKRPVSSGND